MSETLTIKCDGCGSKIGKASRTKVRWAAQPFRREPSDYCPDCTAKVQAAVGRPLPATPRANKGARLDGAAAAP